MQIAVTLPGISDDVALAADASASAAGVGCLPLSGFSAGEGGVPGLLLGFCAFSFEEMDVAMDRLAGVIAARRT